MPDLLEMHCISKRFGEATVLNQVDFTLHNDEVHALLGENGAGKSTLIKILSGIYAPDSGDIFVKGQRRTIHTPKDAKLSGIATVHQDLSLVPQLTVAQNLVLGREPAHHGLLLRKKANESACAAIEEYRFALDPNSAVGSLRYAQQQLVEILRALTQSAEILVFDEPTTSLTLQEEEHLFEIILGLKRRGKGIIYISHRMEEITRLADRVTVLRDGQNVGTISRDEMTLTHLIEMVSGNVRSEPLVRVSPGNGGDPVLRMNHVSTHKLNDISFSLNQGDVVGIAGLVGSGRTSLARVLFGLDKVGSGTIQLVNHPYAPTSPQQAIDAGVALIPEQRRAEGLFSDQTIADNISVASLPQLRTRIGLVNRSKVMHLAKQSIQRFSIKSQGIDQVVGQLSGGTQQKVVIARWVSRNPKLLIMDDPTAGVDIGTKQEIWSLMHQLAKEGTAILFISSDLNELLQACRRIVILRQGELIQDLIDPDEVTVRKFMQGVEVTHEEVSL
jgi:ribose transport system ATP-binding protein